MKLSHAYLNILTIFFSLRMESEYVHLVCLGRRGPSYCMLFLRCFSPMNIDFHRKLLCVAAGIFLGLTLAFGFEPSKEQTYVQIGRLTIRLEMKNASGSYISQGTGFFVEDEKNQLFIVTARHVVVGSGTLRARVPSLVKATEKTEMVVLTLPETAWILGEDDDATLLPRDVAVMKLGVMVDRSVVSFKYCPTTCPSAVNNQLGDDPHPLDHIMIMGFPYDMGFTLKEQRPMVREGVVSLAADEPFIHLDNSPRFMRKGLIIDCHVFGGNSGGPVMVWNPFQPIRLAGLVTGASMGLSFGFVTPTSDIRHVLDKAVDAPMNMSVWSLPDPDEGTRSSR